MAKQNKLTTQRQAHDRAVPRSRPSPRTSRHRKRLLRQGALRGGVYFIPETTLLEAITLMKTDRPTALIRFGPLRTWDTSRVQNFSKVFSSFTFMDQQVGGDDNISGWDTTGATDMSEMFFNCQNFNQALDFQTSNVITMARMFKGCIKFNQPVNFVTEAVMDMSEMFNMANFHVNEEIPFFYKYQSAFNQALTFQSNRVTNMNNMFRGCIALNQPINLITNTVTHMNFMFKGCRAFNQPVTFVTDSVTDMTAMFSGCSAFNQPVTFVTQAVTSMTAMFSGCSAFNQPVTFVTQAVTSMTAMFLECRAFNQPITFNTTNVEDMSYMFYECVAFNQPLTFNTKAVTDMSFMFSSCVAFNQPLTFNTQTVTSMTAMFFNCKTFNQSVNFVTDAVISMSEMFRKCIAFNQPVNFVTNAITNNISINKMFMECNSFNSPVFAMTVDQYYMSGLVETPLGRESIMQKALQKAQNVREEHWQQNRPSDEAQEGMLIQKGSVLAARAAQARRSDFNPEQAWTPTPVRHLTQQEKNEGQRDALRAQVEVTAPRFNMELQTLTTQLQTLTTQRAELREQLYRAQTEEERRNLWAADHQNNITIQAVTVARASLMAPRSDLIQRLNIAEREADAGHMH